MAEEEKSESTGDAPAPKKASGGSNILVTVLVLLNTVLVGAIGFFQKQAMDKMEGQPSVHDVVAAQIKEFANKDDQKPEKGLIAKDEDGKLFPLDSFTANLAQGDGPRRFIRLDTVLKFAANSNEEEYKNRKPQIRDTIISLLNSKRPEDLLKVEGKNFLKEEVRAAINSFLVEGRVIDVYYVGFQIN